MAVKFFADPHLLCEAARPVFHFAGEAETGVDAVGVEDVVEEVEVVEQGEVLEDKADFTDAEETSLAVVELVDAGVVD